MSFSDLYLWGVFTPEDIAVLQKTFRRLSHERWVPDQPEIREGLARYMLALYRRGMHDPEKLYRLTALKAKKERSLAARCDGANAALAEEDHLRQ